LEFVNTSEVAYLLTDQGFAETKVGEGTHLSMPQQDGVVYLDLCTEDSQIEPREAARVIRTTAESLPDLIDQVIHRLNLNDLLLIPVGKWRNVFDAVAFSMAANEKWQEVDAAATVKLTTRDPLLCGPADFHVVIDLIRALISDAEGVEQGLILTATGIPVIVEVIPDGTVWMSIGNEAVADEILEVVPA